MKSHLNLNVVIVLLADKRRNYFLNVSRVGDLFTTGIDEA